MRALGIALLALAAVWPRRRAAQLVLALASGVALVASAWHASFEGRLRGAEDVDQAILLVVAVGLAVVAWWAAPRAHAALTEMGGAWLVLLGSAVAVYGCVPETDQMREVGVVVAAGGVAELLLRRRLPTSALLGAMALVEWSALYGATGRSSALVGGLFALTPLPAVAVAVVCSEGRPAPRYMAWAIAAVWVVAAVVVARTGGIATSLRPAVVAAGLAGAVAGVLSAGLVRRARR